MERRECSETEATQRPVQAGLCGTLLKIQLFLMYIIAFCFSHHRGLFFVSSLSFSFLSY